LLSWRPCNSKTSIFIILWFLRWSIIKIISVIYLSIIIFKLLKPIRNIFIFNRVFIWHYIILFFT
jgi:hypothetical protein